MRVKVVNARRRELEAGPRGGLTGSSNEASVMDVEPSGQPGVGILDKPKGIIWRGTQRDIVLKMGEVVSAWERVKAKGGKGGVDEVSIKDFEEKLDKNLYKVWNRMTSGSYHPQAVLRVEIPKGKGEKRKLGIPTILDRVAQQVVRARLEKVLEPIFHSDSYGYRVNQSGPAAVKTCRSRCWSYDWVLDIDIRSFFDNIDHDLLLKAVRHHCEEKWMVMYIERWLKAPVQEIDGTCKQVTKGTPQGGVISPLLANLYLHYALDMWMDREYPEVKFERYADDAVIHCKTEEEALEIRNSLEERLKVCGLSLHPKKTKVVYCKDSNRKRTYPETRFKFLGYTFEARTAENKQTGKRFLSFQPAMSNEAGKRLRDKLRATKYFRLTFLSVEDLAGVLNPVVRGFYNYFSECYPSRLSQLSRWLNWSIVRWWRRKTGCGWKKAWRFFERIKSQQPNLFAHWTF